MQRPGFSFLVCPDAELIRERIDQSLAERAETADWPRKTFWADEPLADEFWRELSVSSLFGGGKALIVRRAHLAPAAFWDQLAGPLKGFNASVWPFFCLEAEQDPRKGPSVPRWIVRQKYWEAAQKLGFVWTSAGLDARGLAAFVQNHARLNGLEAPGPAAQALAAVLPTDGRAARLELDKLALYLRSQGRTAFQPDDARLVERAEGVNVFDLLKGLMASPSPVRDARVWRQLIESRLGGDELIFPLLAMLQSEARMLWQLAHDEPLTRNLPPFVIKEKREMAGRLGSRRIGRIWDACLKAEFSIKTGQATTEQALDMLAADLFALLRAPRPTAPQAVRSAGAPGYTGSAGR